MIEIKGLTFNACHGVLDGEKVTPQPFVFDIRLDFDSRAARSSDDVRTTVNYAEVCERVKEVCLCNSFNLIEKLARECAFAIMERFERAAAVTVRVSKPMAPVKAKFGNISAEYALERNDVYLSLGSSMGDRKAYLDFAVKELASTRGITVKKVSSYTESAPYGGVAKNMFLNACVAVDTYLPPRALLNEIHRIEEAGERSRSLRWDDRTLDIDIIFYGRQVICEDGLTVPHPEYSRRAFVLEPLKEIAPDFFCPLTGARIKDLVAPGG